MRRRAPHPPHSHATNRPLSIHSQQPRNVVDVTRAHATTRCCCHICQDIIAPPATPVRSVSCGHVFCDLCLSTWHGRMRTILYEREHSDSDTEQSPDMFDKVGGCPVCRAGASATSDEYAESNQLLPVRALMPSQAGHTTLCVGGCTHNIHLQNAAYLLQPCGHCICERCAPTDNRIAWNCTVCRTPVTGLVRNVAVHILPPNETPREEAPPPPPSPQHNDDDHDAVSSSSSSSPASTSSSASSASSSSSDEEGYYGHQDRLENQMSETPHHVSEDAPDNVSSSPTLLEPRHVPVPLQPVPSQVRHPMHRRLGAHESVFAYMCMHSTFYTNFPPIEALHTFLGHEGRLLRLYGVDRTLYAEHGHQREWGCHEVVTWNLYIDLLLRVCRTHHHIDNLLDCFDLTTALAAKSRHLLVRVQELIRMRMFLGATQAPYYRRVCALEALSWRHHTYDTDACAPWKLELPVHTDMPRPPSSSPPPPSPPPPPAPPGFPRRPPHR